MSLLGELQETHLRGEQFLAASALLTPEEEETCRDRAKISQVELLALADERLRTMQQPTEPGERTRFQAKVIFGIMAERYREKVMEMADAKRKMLT